MTSAMIYWLTRLDGIKNVLSTCTVLGVLCLSGVACAMAVSLFEDSSINDALKKWLKKATAVVIAIGILNTFLPSSKEMVAIYLLPKIANNENVKEIPNKGMEILNLKLERCQNIKDGDVFALVGDGKCDYSVAKASLNIDEDFNH